VRKGREPAPDVGAIRAKLGLTQEQFATLCGVSVATVRNWEQHRRVPRGPSRPLLQIVELEPKAALRVVRSTAA
jgi:putative transcriptional regulator